MGPTRSHPLPPGIFVQMPSPPPVEMPATSNEFDDWTEKDFSDEIDRLNKRLKELDEIKKEEYDSDDIMNDPDVREMVENGEHICHMFDGECLACEMDEDEDEEEDEVEMSAQVGKVDELRAHFC